MLAYRILFTRNSDKAGLVHNYNIFMDMEGFKEKSQGIQSFKVQRCCLRFYFNLFNQTDYRPDFPFFVYLRSVCGIRAYDISLINSIARMYLCMFNSSMASFVLHVFRFCCLFCRTHLENVKK